MGVQDSLAKSIENMKKVQDKAAEEAQKKAEEAAKALEEMKSTQTPVSY